MAGSVLCSRGMGLRLMSGLTSGNIAGGTNTLKPCDKARVTAASPLLFKSASIRVCESESERGRENMHRSCGEALRGRGGRLAALITMRGSL